MGKELQETCAMADAALRELDGAPREPDRVVGVAQVLQCKSSEDDDGATGRRIIRLDSCRMHDPLLFAVAGNGRSW